MFKRRVVVMVAATAAALLASGCVKTLKDSTFRGISLDPSVKSSLTVADLEVAPQKVMGTAQGKAIHKPALEREALAKAIRAADPSGVGADVLVGANYYYEVSDPDIIVTIIGYPARYRNFRPEKNSDGVFTIQSMGGSTVVSYDTKVAAVERFGAGMMIKEVKEEAAEGAPAAEAPATETLSDPAAAPAVPTPEGAK